MRRQDVLDNMALAWEVTQLGSPVREVLCMDMYAPIMGKLFSFADGGSTIGRNDPQD